MCPLDSYMPQDVHIWPASLSSYRVLDVISWSFVGCSIGDLVVRPLLVCCRIGFVSHREAAEFSFLSGGETMLLLRDLVRRKVLREDVVPDTSAVSGRSPQFIKRQFRRTTLSEPPCLWERIFESLDSSGFASFRGCWGGGGLRTSYVRNANVRFGRGRLPVRCEITA